jgi:hypothetical protein
MQWAAASSDTTIERPFLVWQPKDKGTYNDLKQKLEEQIQKLDLAVDKQRENALEPGTTERQLLDGKNKEISQENERRKRLGLRGRKHLYTPARFFEKEDLKQAEGTGGIDFVFYAFECYRKRLFPYVQKLRELHPRKRVVITEDNAPCHLKTRRLLAPEIKELGIEFLDWPANSPDLHPI